MRRAAEEAQHGHDHQGRRGIGRDLRAFGSGFVRDEANVAAHI
jgi:hypothetical protein